MDLNWISSIINLKSGKVDQKNTYAKHTASYFDFYTGFPLPLSTKTSAFIWKLLLFIILYRVETIAEGIFMHLYFS